MVQAPAVPSPEPLLFSPARSLRRELGWLFGCLALALAVVAATGFWGLHQYRQMARDLRRVEELPVAAELTAAIGDLHIAVAEHLKRQQWTVPRAGGKSSPGLDSARANVCKRLEAVRHHLSEYEAVLRQASATGSPLAETYKEEQVVRRMKALLDELQQEYHSQAPVSPGVESRCEQLQRLAGKLPAILQRRLNNVPDQLRNRYRLQIQAVWFAAAASLLLLVWFVWRFSRRVLVPLRNLIRGARLIARGNLDYRFKPSGENELGLLALLLNRMIEKFCRTRDRLDEQAQHHARQAMRNQRLAVVGLLATGVGRQIDPSLRQIAEAGRRLHRWGKQSEPTVEANVLRQLQHIQRAAFECKQITQELLQLARDDHAPQAVELNRLVAQTLESWRRWYSGSQQPPEPGWQPGPDLRVVLVPHEFRIALLALLRGFQQVGAECVQLTLRQHDRHAVLCCEFPLPNAATEPWQRQLTQPLLSEEPGWLSLAAALFAEAGIRLQCVSHGKQARVELAIPCVQDSASPGEAA